MFINSRLKAIYIIGQSIQQAENQVEAFQPIYTVPK